MKKLQPVPLRAKRQIRKLEIELDATRRLLYDSRAIREEIEKSSNRVEEDYMYLRTVLIDIVAQAAGLSISEARERVEHLIVHAKDTPHDLATAFATRKVGSSGSYQVRTKYTRPFGSQ